MRASAAKAWLAGVCVLLCATGLFMALAIVPPFTVLNRLVLDIVFWPPAGDPAALDTTARFLLALSGAMLIGWSITLYGPFRFPGALGPAGVRRIVLPALTAWFVIYMAGSWWTGATLNLVVNIALYAAIAVPVMAVVWIGRDD